MSTIDEEASPKADWMFIVAGLVVCAAASGCSSPPRPVASAPATPSTPSLFLPVVEPSRSTLDLTTAWLEARHHADIVILDSLGLVLGSTRRRALIVYAFESFTAWRGYNELPDWEREGAEWSAMGEFDIWMEGLEDEGLEEAAQQAFVELLAACEGNDSGAPSQPAPQCTESEIWARALELVGYVGCGLDRVGVATFDFEVTADAGGERPTNRSIELVDGRRCHGTASTLLALDIGRNEDIVLVFELSWVSEIRGQPFVVEHVELRLLDDELRDQLRRELVLRERERAPGVHSTRSSLNVREAWYWFELGRRGESARLVIESFSVEERCLTTDCSRLRHEINVSPCVALRGNGSTSVCQTEELERTVLTFDARSNVWL